MKKLLNREKTIIFLMILIELLMSGLVFLNYTLERPLFNIEKEVAYTALIGIIIFLNIIYLVGFMAKINLKINKIGIRINSLINNNTKDIYLFGNIGIIFYDKDFEIIWVNEFIESRRIDLVGKNILEYNSEFEKIIIDKNDSLKITIDGMVYTCKSFKELKMVVLRDETKYENLLKTYNDEAPVIANISIDNYSDVLAVLDEVKMSELEAKVRNTINEWAKSRRIVLRKVRNDAYIAFLQESKYQTIFNEKFSLVQQVRSIVDEESNLTISIGIGRGINDYVKLSEMAASAIDVALSRGGDQVVVNNYGKNMDFYGGASEAKSKRHKVKVKVVSKSLTALIQSSKKVFIMGHLEADFDAIGGCLGVYSLSKQFKKETRIVYEDKLVEIKARSAFRQSFEKEEIDEMIIGVNSALDQLDGNSLLILVDVSNPLIAMSSKLVEKAERIAVIDHHRPGDKIISQVFSYQEPAASSTCEMVAELIRSTDQKIRITPEVATLMLTGILLDTNNYKSKTGLRTYEASMILKEYGADNNQAIEYLKDEYEEHQLKTKIMANSFTPYYGVVVCVAPADDIIDKTYLAKVAQEILDLKGVKCSFVIGFVKDGVVGISARSDSTVNIQVIMESMGGGGHFSAAATQISSTDIEAVKKDLFHKLEGFIGDTRVE